MIPSAFVLLSALPLSPNGKLDRRALPPPDWEQSPSDEAFCEPCNAQEHALATIWAEVLRLKHVGIRDNFFELGGDSILSLQIITRAKQRGMHFTLKQLFQYQTIEELSAMVKVETSTQAEQGLVVGSVPLTPIQHWFFDHSAATPHHWNQALFLNVPRYLQWSFLEETVRVWLRHHDALRLRFIPDRDGWQQSLSVPEEDIPCSLVDISSLADQDQDTTASKLAAETQVSLNVVTGPLLRVVLFDRGPDRLQQLLLVIHHLVVDGVSWRILLEDLQTAYEQLAQGQVIQLPAKTTSFKQWAEHLVEYAQSSAIQQEQTYWLKGGRKPVQPLPLDFSLDGQVNTMVSVRVVFASLTVEETQKLLEEVPVVYHTQINEVLLTALAQTLVEWVGSSVVLIDLEGHGREDLFLDVDISRTVGWFTSLFPVYLDLTEVVTVAEAVNAVKEQLRAIPNHGIGYGILRYLCPDPALIEQMGVPPQAEVSFNYLGQFNQMGSSSVLAEASLLPAGPTHDPQGKRTHLLEMNCQISGGQFSMAWSYNERIHHRSSIERLAAAFTDVLRAIIRQGQSSEVGGYIPSDFPDVELSREQLEQVLLEIDLD